MCCSAFPTVNVVNRLGGIIESSSRRESALPSAKCSRVHFEPAYVGCHEMKALIKPVPLLAIVALCLFEFVLRRESDAFREFEVALASLQWMLLVCIAVWCGTFLSLMFGFRDLPLTGPFLIAIAASFITYVVSQPATDAIILFGELDAREGGALRTEKQKAESGNDLEIGKFLIGLVVLLASASWWHLEMKNNFYHGPR